MTHDCPGDTCADCNRRIARAEERDPDRDYPDGLDWHWPIGTGE